MKITIDISQQAGEWLFWRVLKQGPEARIEAIAATMLEQAIAQAQQEQLEQQAQQDEQGKQ